VTSTRSSRPASNKGCKPCRTPASPVCAFSLRTYAMPPLHRLLLVVLSLATTPLLAMDWVSNEIQYLQSDHYREPFNSSDVSKQIITLQHASGYSLGRNFAFVDILKSGNQERNLSGQSEAPSETYGEAYTTLSLGKLTHNQWSFGPVKDVGLTAGINAGSKSSQLHPQPRVYLAGVTFDFDVPKGFFNVDVLGYWDHGCYQGTNTCPNYSNTYQVTPSWSLPFSIGSVDGEFTGFIDFIGSRGVGTMAQVLTQPQIRFDLGKPFGQAGRVYGGIEYQYWKNKFGNDGVNEHHPQLLLLLKF